ncbi:fimbria/pilus outer membrane usher protein [Salmonella enterica]
MTTNIAPTGSIPVWRKRRLAYFIVTQFVMLCGVSFTVQARDYFNPAMLEMDNPHQQPVDLTVFENGYMQPPGIYHVDLYLNNELQERRDVTFRMVKGREGKESLQPCLSVALLKAMGVQTEMFPKIGDARARCANFSAIPQASAEFRFGSQQLLLSIPQAALSQKARGYVPESQWDEGIPALLFNYSLSGANTYRRHGNGGHQSSQYANLRPGINIGPWRLRNYTSYVRDNQGRMKWDTIFTYAQRNIVSLKSQLTLGDSSSPSHVFDTIPFRGVQLASDDDMIPDSLKGYAPVVRGIARTHAQVMIRQGGYVIYQRYVPPGAFEINDMYPTGGSGDLHVTIKEADGSEQHLIVPFASLPVLQREGRLQYSITGGQYRAYDRDVNKTPFGQGTGSYGLPAGFTVYGGGQFASNYQSLSLGLGKNLGAVGAVSTDVTQAWSKMSPDSKERGQSWRIRHSKNIAPTGTNFAIAGYRYSTAGYYSLQEVLESYRKQPFSSPFNERKRNRTEITLTQNLWKQAGSLSFSLLMENYWNSNRTMRSIGAGYSNSWKGISYGIDYSYNENATAKSSRSGKVYDHDQLFSINISVPLNVLSGNMYASYHVNSSRSGGTTHSVGLNGTALTDNNLSWSVQQGYGNRDTGYSGNLNADYRGTYGEVVAGYAYDRNNQQVNYGVQGGIVAHQDGITFGQPLGETLALVKANGANGVGVSNQTGVKTDWRGYTIAPYVTPYRKNAVQLNTETLPDNIDLTLASQYVVPTRGAVVRANFEANVGYRVLMTITYPDKNTVPFGARVRDLAQKQEQIFIVGDNGQVYLTGMSGKGQLVVKWGNHPDQLCKVNYSLPSLATEIKGIRLMTGHCVKEK